MRHWFYWLVGFDLTLLLEAPIVFRFLARSEPRRGRRLCLLLFANCATHPLVWFFFPLLPLSRSAIVGMAETWAWGAETVFYWTMSRRLSLREAALMSLLANAFSFLVGLFLLEHFRDYFFPR